MKKQKIFDLFKEVANLWVSFFRPYQLIDPIFAIPSEVRKLGIKVNSFTLISTILSILFSFMLKGTNMLITHKFILLGIIMFMLYRGQQLLSSSLNLFRDSEEAKFHLIFNDEIVFRGSSIIGKVSNRVSRYDPKNKIVGAGVQLSRPSHRHGQGQ